MSGREYLGEGIEALGQAADAAVRTLLRDHSARSRASDLALDDLEGLAGLCGVPSLEQLAVPLHHGSHLASNVLVSLPTALGLADSLEGGLVVGQHGLLVRGRGIVLRPVPHVEGESSARIERIGPDPWGEPSGASDASR